MFFFVFMWKWLEFGNITIILFYDAYVTFNSTEGSCDADHVNKYEESDHFVSMASDCLRRGVLELVFHIIAEKYFEHTSESVIA